VIYLLDTNVCIELMRGNARVLETFTRCRADDIGVSAVTIFELFAGVERCRQPAAEGAKVNHFLEPLHSLAFDEVCCWGQLLPFAAARFWERIRCSKVPPRSVIAIDSSEWTGSCESFC
jgi:predicted nucleic acid-binding protein